MEWMWRKRGHDAIGTVECRQRRTFLINRVCSKSTVYTLRKHSHSLAFPLTMELPRERWRSSTSHCTPGARAALGAVENPGAGGAASQTAYPHAGTAERNAQ